MAGESDASARELYETPTWAVALVCAVMIIISLLLEKGLHHIGEV
jgi:mlo protein